MPGQCDGVAAGGAAAAMPKVLFDVERKAITTAALRARTDVFVGRAFKRCAELLGDVKNIVHGYGNPLVDCPALLMRAGHLI